MAEIGDELLRYYAIALTANFRKALVELGMESDLLRQILSRRECCLQNAFILSC